MKLKELRKNKKMTQEEVSKYLNIARSTYNGYEQNISEPTIETLSKLADLYEVSLDQLVGREFKDDIGYLTFDQKNIVMVIKKLNEKNLSTLLGTALRLLNEQ